MILYFSDLYPGVELLGHKLDSSRVSQMMLVVKNLPPKAGDRDCEFDPWVGKIPGAGHGNSLRYSCLENSMEEEPGGL